jgi:monoamine oxidase
MKTLIVGGGLSGLALAEALQARGEDYLIVEARSRFGGRIMTMQQGPAHFDMGPAWFWPGQPRMDALLTRLGLERFEQHSDGILTFENEQGQVQRGRGHASMQGSWRVQGGLTALTDALANRLPANRKRMNAQVAALHRSDTGVTAHLSDGEKMRADRVVLALPPRVAATFNYVPALPPKTLQTMQNVPTWMAGQAKAMAVYDTPFWRDAGLSGDAISRMGPMVEIHDASPAHSGPYALFGFIGAPPQARGDVEMLSDQVKAQLGRLFGPAAAKPAALFIKDWATDPRTSTRADLAPLYAHPTYALPTDMANLWGGELVFAGTEVAPEFGGYLEGALEAAENVLMA